MSHTISATESQDFDDFLDTCPHEDSVDRVLWLFDHGQPIPEVSPDAMRLYSMQNAESGVLRHYFITLLRDIATGNAVGVHVLRPFRNAAPECFFGGWSTNTYAQVPGGQLQFFVEPEVDLTVPLINTPSFVSQDFADGTCPPIVPYRTTVWTRQPHGAPLRRATLSKWDFSGVAA